MKNEITSHVSLGTSKLECLNEKERKSINDRSRRIIDIILDGDIPSAS